jgi:HD-like signal output (HDOD) protein
MSYICGDLRFRELSEYALMITSVAATVNWEQLRQSILSVANARPAPPWVKLPSPPTALLRCMQKSKDPAAAAADLAPLIEKDAGLTCQILRFANSSNHGFAQPAQTVALALSRLGIRQTLMYLTAEVMNQAMKASSSKLLNINAFAATSLERALFARRIARLLGADDELAYCAALISDSLLPVVTNQAFRTYLRFAEEQSSAPKRLIEFEQKEFRWTHPWMTASIVHAWGFPDDLTCCIALHHTGVRLLEDPTLRCTATAAVAVASLLPDQLPQEPDGLRQLRQLNERLPGFDLKEIAQAVDAEFRETCPELENPFPLVRQLSRHR